jgi:hypothetical protein
MRLEGLGKLGKNISAQQKSSETVVQSSGRTISEYTLRMPTNRVPWNK